MAVNILLPLRIVLQEAKNMVKAAFNEGSKSGAKTTLNSFENIWLVTFRETSTKQGSWPGCTAFVWLDKKTWIWRNHLII